MTRKATQKWVNQGDLAKVLDLTARRVRQLVSEGILHEAIDGKWDVTVEAERYSLYRSTDPDRWDEILTAAEHDAVKVDHLIERAVSSSGTGPNIERAAEAADALLDKMLLIATIRSKSTSDRTMFSEMFRLNHRAQMQALSSRMFEVWSNKTGIPPDVIAEKLRNDIAATSA